MSLFSSRFGPSFAAMAERAGSTPGARVIDVRTAEEYASGHLPGAENIPLDRLPEHSFAAGEKLFVYCRSGARSGRAAAWLQGQGAEAVNMGGIAGYFGTLERGR